MDKNVASPVFRNLFSCLICLTCFCLRMIS
uniref:Uncharacterized protein n=1 Tax=Anguilla anguilla TaxID=7936 RepID=A0A0E9VKE8_ANGAN